MHPIHGISNFGAFPLAPPFTTPLTTVGSNQLGPGLSFSEVLSKSIEGVNKAQQQAEQSIEQLVTGGDVGAAEVFTAVQKADMSLGMLLQIHNKLVEAYQQIQNLQI